ncbi:MAG: hypothetical protein ABL994_25610, partial [Verrucomicrobiales bacterium]
MKPFTVRSIPALSVLFLTVVSLGPASAMAGVSRGFNLLLESVVRIDVREVAFEAGVRRYSAGIGSGVILSSDGV